MLYDDLAASGDRWRMPATPKRNFGVNPLPLPDWRCNPVSRTATVIASANFRVSDDTSNGGMTRCPPQSSARSARYVGTRVLEGSTEGHLSWRRRR